MFSTQHLTVDTVLVRKHVSNPVHKGVTIFHVWLGFRYGITLTDFAEILIELGLKNAINLDGGV